MSRRRVSAEPEDAWWTFDEEYEMDRDQDDYESSYLGWRRDEL